MTKNIIDDLYNSIDDGRLGKNRGIATGIDKMDSYTGGIQRGIYYLIFGTSGSGKTSLALYSYIYRPLKDNKDKNFLIVYFSLEMSSKQLLGKLLALYLFETYGDIVSYKSLMSWSDRLNDTLYEHIQEARTWLESVMPKLIIIDSELNRDKFYSVMMTVLESRGDMKTDENHRKVYTPNDPELLIIGVVDHVGLCKPKPGSSKKDEIDAISSYAVSLREHYGISWVFLQQENRNSASMDRRKSDLTECSSEDLKDTGNTFNDCDVCIGVYNPIKFKIKVHRGFPIILDKSDLFSDSDFIGMRDRYRALCLIKNRQGDPDKLVSVNFFGEIGMFRQLPKAKDIPDFSVYMHLNNCKEEKDKDVKDVEKEDSVKVQQLSYNF